MFLNNMLLHKSEVEVESEGVQSEQMFGFEDSEVLYTILRDKMYSNAISAVCREVSCNARDAHREVGTPELPITIHLPTRFEPFFKVRDQGPGISPDRMGIFTQYGASTKRGDNLQTGGFGLGAKTPFAYADVFTIVTVTDGVKRTYTAQIEETRKGKMSLLSELPTDEHNGTEIVLAVEQKDFDEFARWTHHSTKHWTVKPNIVGNVDKITYKDIRSKAIKSGEGWFLIPDDESDDNSGHLRAVIDGIEYPINTANFKAKEWQARDAIFTGDYTLFMEFPTGACALSPNREQLGMDNNTQDELIQKFNKVKKELAAVLQVEVNKAITYKSACSIVRQHAGKLGGNYLNLVTWNGKVIHYDGIPIKGMAAIYKFEVEVKKDDSACYTRIKGGIRSDFKRFGERVSVSPKTEVFINDTNHDLRQMLGSQVKKLVDGTIPLPTGYDKDRYIQIVTFNDNVSRDNVIEIFGTDNIHYLSKFLKSKREVKERPASTKESKERLDLFKLVNGSFERCSKTDYNVEDNDKKIVVALTNDYRSHYVARGFNGNTMRTEHVSSIAREFGVEVFGVKYDLGRPEINKRLPGCVWIDEFVKNKMLNLGLSDEVLVEISTYDYITRQGLTRIGSGYGTENSFYYRLAPLITDQTSNIATTILELQRLSNLHEKHSGLLNINVNVFGTSFGKVDNDLSRRLQKSVQQIREEYPFLPTATNRIDINHIAEYVNFVTESNNNKKAVVQQNP